MIELTVKTLDSQNHKFSVADDITVKQFKEKIAGVISIPADTQRLIYCGRVLQDDKNLNEYDVNGKVIHLVQRAPPPATSGSNNSNGRRQQSGNANHRRIHYHHHHYHRQPRFDGNTMYFGAMAIPADLIEDQGVRTPSRQTSTRTQTRIAFTQHMLNRAQGVLTRLENPDASPETVGSNEEHDNTSNSSRGENTTSGGAPNIGGLGASTQSSNSQANSISGSIMQAAHAATAAAIAAAVSAVQAAGLPNINIMQEPQPRGPESTENGTSEQPNQGNGSEEQNQGTEDFPNSSSSTPPEDSGLAEETTRRTIEAPRTAALAEVLELLSQTNTRLQPFLQQYQNLMQSDPPADANGQSVESMQRTFDSVSEVMHYLSHAYHAMSDIICDFSQAPPRNLRSRPVVIHSSVWQAGIPIQAQINVMGSRSASNTGSRQQSPSENNPSTNAPATATTQSNDTNAQPEATPPPQQPNPTQRPQARPNRSQAPTGLPPVVSISPGNVEFFMELGQGGTIDSIQVVSNRSGSTGSESSNTTAPGNTTQPNVSWRRPSSAELIENLMQAMAGQMMMGRGGANSATVTINGSVSSSTNSRTRTGTGTTTSTTATTSSTNSTSSATATAAPGGGQNSQARGNTATHPTTSTQTRSTSRPYVQLAPAALQGLVANSFDPFLQCNSHHLNSPRRRSRPQQSTPNATSTEQQAQTTTPTANEPAQTNNSDQSNMSRMDLLIAFINHWLGSGARSANISTSESGGTSANSGEGASTRPERPAAPSDSLDRGLLDQLNIPLEISWLRLLNQLRQGNTQNEGAASVMFQRSPTVADFLQTVPDYSYSEGESFLTDLIMLVARNMTFENMIALSVGHSCALDQMQPQLNEFVLQRVLLGQLPTQESITEAVNRILLELQPPADIMEAAHIREDVDLTASVNKFCQVRFGELIRLILTKTNPCNFGRSLMALCSVILKELTSLLLACCDGGEREVESMIQIAVRHLTSGVHPELQHWTINSSLTRFRNYVARINIRSVNVQEFIVYRSAARNIANSEKPSSSPKEVTSPEPMDTDSTAHAPLEPSVVENGVVAKEDKEESSSEDVTMETENISEVLLQSESWPSSLPSDWVPIIARDTIRQRRQGPQPPFSDVYLAGMPSKRRKVVSNSKRRGNVSQIISERVRHAVEASGVGTSVSRDGATAGPEQVGQAAAGDIALQQAYREHVLFSLRQRIHSDPDFNPERFPNTANYLLK